MQCVGKTNRLTDFPVPSCAQISNSIYIRSSCAVFGVACSCLSLAAPLSRQLFDVVETKDWLYLVMELVQARRLHGDVVL